MTRRPLLLCAVTSLLACACAWSPRPTQTSAPPGSAPPTSAPPTSAPPTSAPPTSAPPTSAPHASEFEAEIDRIRRTDPGSPAILSAQLAYAEFLLGETEGPCAERLQRVQEQLLSVEASPKTRVMFPDGWARATDLEYRLHLARAICNETNRENELRSAVAAARHALELYRNALDYHSMAITQFEVGIVLHQLGDSAALAAVETALDMDREYGFPDDARENYKLLLSWRGEPADDAHIARLMQDFPKRRAVLQFGWRPGTARTTLESHRASLDDGRIVASRGGATFECSVAAGNGGGWSVSHTDRLTRYEPGVWPTMQGPQAPPQMVFPPAAPPPLDFKVSATGGFEGVTDSRKFAARLVARTDELIRAAAPSGAKTRGLLSAALEASSDTLSPGMLEAATAETYQLETAMWVGATLEQGVWYEVSAPLSLPGMPRAVVEHLIEFAFTRMVPCTAGAAKQACVEIVIRATPDEEALDQLVADAGLTAYSTSTEARIVTDPATLLPQAREQWGYWYASSNTGKRDSVLRSEHLVSTTSYAAH